MHKILIFEEKNIFSRSLKEILSLEGFDVINVKEDSDNMIEYLKAQSPDLILIDKDFQFYKSQISLETDSFSNIPVIYISNELKKFSDNSKLTKIIKDSFEKQLDDDFDK